MSKVPLRRLGFLDSRKLGRAGGRHYYFIRHSFLRSLAQRAFLLSEEIKQSLKSVPLVPHEPVPSERAGSQINEKWEQNGNENQNVVPQVPAANTSRILVPVEHSTLFRRDP